MARVLLLLLAGLSGGLCQKAPQVETRNGSYTGVHLPLLNQDYFLGMPFAQPPVQGPLRFSPPASLNTSWTGSRDATQFGNICYGYGNDNNRLAALGFKISEDCLSINVARPSNYTDQSLPVAVYIYGGGYFQGGSADPRLNFSSIIRDSVAAGKPIIGVSFNYRLSAFGFLGGSEIVAAGAANLGFRDQRLALNWLSANSSVENIAAFGGDPTKVTIFGNSAGAGSVGAQLLAYNGRDDGLFRGAISQSGAPAGFSPFSPFLDVAKWDEVYENITVGIGCSTTDALNCLRNVPIEVLNAVVNSTATSGASYGLVFDGDFVADAPGAQLAKGNFVKVPYIIGHNTDEGSAFIPGNNFDNATFYPTSKIDTDEQFREYIASLKANETVASRVFDIYRQNATDHALATYPDDLGAELGYQYKRAVTLAGDSNIIAPTRYTAQMWAAYNVPLYKYRWDVIVSGLPRYIGATHAKEIFFVFDDQSRDDYDVWPLQDKPQSFSELASIMATAWASFVATGDPNSNGSVNGTNWPLYNEFKENFVFTGNITSHVENDDTREQEISFLSSLF
ncbi:lipase 2 [Colletotrichum paranaense]|uniref:Carboxylic ester hydrolase n=1 Tax=Colletotrichum paranaense TaxID=1914294 RepID=A0ABQ9SJ80_9PEZI|nr:lipase 2 [Colletotrichum paranaense]KAK1537851.1 lipase 2 [Colletotrichum paranaense]